MHQACYGVSKVPKGSWSCRPCRASSKDIVRGKLLFQSYLFLYFIVKRKVPLFIEKILRHENYEMDSIFVSLPPVYFSVSFSNVIVLVVRYVFFVVMVVVP